MLDLEKYPWLVAYKLWFTQVSYSHVQQVYLSILYLRIPEHFRIILRGQVVKLHNIADDLKQIQYILYTPQSGGSKKVLV